MTAPLEWAANGMTAVAIVLAGRNNVHTWWTGIVGCTLFAILFAESRLYADVALQGFFVATSVAGWWKWARGDQGDPLPALHDADGREPDRHLHLRQPHVGEPGDGAHARL